MLLRRSCLFVGRPLGCTPAPLCSACLLQVKQIQDFKRSLPKEAKLVVCKNTLMRRAADEVAGWSELNVAAKVRSRLRGPAWVRGGWLGVWVGLQHTANSSAAWVSWSAWREAGGAAR